MKCFKSLSKILVLVLALTVVGVYPVSADPVWPETPYVYTNTSSATTGVTFGIKGDKTTTKNIQNLEFAVIETTYTHADVNANYYMQLLGNDGGTGDSYWEPVRFKTNGDIVVNHSAYGTPSSQVTIGKAVIGETYHIVAAIYTNGTQTNGRVFINGQEVSIGQYLQNNPATRPYYRIFTLPRSTTTIKKLAGVTGIANFDYSGYQAQLTSTEPGVTFTGDKTGNNKLYASFGITVKKGENITASTFKGYLTKPDGATFEVYQADGTTPLGDSENISTGCIVKSTSQNGKTVLNYKVAFTPDWPLGPFVYTNTSSATTGVRFGIKGDKTTNKNIQNGEFAVIETTYTHADVNTNYYIQLLGSDGGTGESYWEPVRFKTNGDIVVNHSAYGTASSQVTIGKAVIGETYHIVAVIYTNGTQTNGRVFINGQEVSIGQYLQNNPALRPYYYIYGLPNSTTTITKLAGVTGIADFDYSGYQAQLSSSNPYVTFTGTKDGKGDVYADFVIELAKESMTKAELSTALVDSSATFTICDADGVELANDSEPILNGYKVKTTSQNGNANLEYAISFVATDDIVFTTSASGNLTATLYESEAASGNLFLAAYDNSGAIIELTKVDIGVRVGESCIVEATLLAEDIADKKVKAFYWSLTYVPVVAEEYIAQP